MAFTQLDIDTLQRAIASGTSVVQFQDRRVEYQTTEDMIKALALMTASVPTSPPIRRQTRIYTQTGW